MADAAGKQMEGEGERAVGRVGHGAHDRGGNRVEQRVETIFANWADRAERRAPAAHRRAEIRRDDGVERDGGEADAGERLRIERLAGL